MAQIKKSKDLTDTFYSFLERRDPATAARDLRRILHGYLIWNMEAGVNPDMREEIWLISDLIDLLEQAESK